MHDASSMSINTPYLNARSRNLYHDLNEGMFRTFPTIGNGLGPGGSWQPRALVVQATAMRRYHSTATTEMTIAEIESVMLALRVLGPFSSKGSLDIRMSLER